MSKLHVLSFMFTPFCRRCPLAQNFCKFCTLCFKILHVLTFRPNTVRFFG
ncbi:hypothetical protein Hdeb2414_s0009g00323331 [Helianthus debilis subsp. tardiflorus]